MPFQHAFKHMAASADPPETLDQPQQVKSKYRPEIDGLRAFAVLAVILNHLNKDFLPNGYLGVDIFFVISGYVITSSLAGRESKNLADFLSGFYGRRIKRLVPALVVFVLVTSVGICLFNPEPKTALQTARASLLGWSNLYLLEMSTDYFAQASELNPFTHTWSLGVEEQFYLLFPLLIWFSGFARQAEKGARNLFLWIGTLAAASLLAFISLYQTNQPAAYFLMPTRFWEMAAGCLIFIGFQKRQRIEQELEKVPPLWVVAGMVAVMFSPIQLAVPATIAIVVLSSLLIACLKDGTAAFAVFSHRRVVAVGLISYSLYLWHWGILSLSRWTIGIHWWSVPIQLALMLLASLLSYKHIETPARHASPSQARGIAILTGLGALFGSGLLIAVLTRGAEQKLLYAGAPPMLPGAENFERRETLRLADSHLNGRICHADRESSRSQLRYMFDHCVYPQARVLGKKTVAFVGDSHTLALLPAEQAIINEGGRILHHSHDGCPFPRPPYGILPKECDRFLIEAEDNLINHLSAGDVVVVFNYHLSHLGGAKTIDFRRNIIDAEGERPSDEKTRISLYLQAVKRFAANANQKGVNIIFVGAGCRNSEVAMLHREWFRPFPSAETVANEVESARRLNQRLRAGFATISNLTFLEPNEILSTCSEPSQYLKLYRDTDHLSQAGAALLMREILAAVGSLDLNATPRLAEESRQKKRP